MTAVAYGCARDLSHGPPFFFVLQKDGLHLFIYFWLHSSSDVGSAHSSIDKAINQSDYELLYPETVWCLLVSK